VESLTWRPRRIQLIPDIGSANIHVSQMKFEKGDSTRMSWIDASLAYRYDQDKVTPMRMRENKPLWRDAGPLFLLNEDEHGMKEKKSSFRRPDVVEQAFSVLKEVDDPLMVHVYGMRTDMKMKVYEWAKASWRVPAKLGRSTRLGSLVQQELDRAEKAAYYLRIGIKALYPREGAGNKKALGAIANRCERSYWQQLESGFYPLLSAFSTLNPDAPNDPEVIVGTAQDWRKSINDLALENFESGAKDMDADGDALERQVHARTRLKNKLREVLS
jgi:CRISPR type I-E-associated protein CasA/Cse1